MAISFLALGGNIGDVVTNMAGALQCLNRSRHSDVVSVSKVYRTPPWGIKEQDWFHNACAKLSTALEPLELLHECLKIEKSFHRERGLRWGPRTLDLDILLYEDQTIDLDNLTIPHPRMHERLFVMQPLADIAPEIEILGRTSVQWCQQMETDGLEKIALPEDWWKAIDRFNQ
ncbi:MAG: 2-amino-4-hydroxy-6-hydroxymethyldihydropteridine diphosphokinase [Pseudomonadota bacterium]